MRVDAILVSLGEGETYYFKQSDDLVAEIRSAVDDGRDVTATDLRGRELTFNGSDVESWDTQRIEDSAVTD